MSVIKNTCIALLVLSTFGIQAQLAETSELHQLLKKQDSILFNAAFNTCDTNALEQIFTKDFEFYHDKGGFTESREAFLNPIKENCANWNSETVQPSKRILIAGSLKVYPLYKNGTLYGAVQHGVHRFVSLSSNREYEKGDIAKFTHVWILEEEQWKVKRELSYDHQYKPE